MRNLFGWLVGHAGQRDGFARYAENEKSVLTFVRYGKIVLKKLENI